MNKKLMTSLLLLLPTAALAHGTYEATGFIASLSHGLTHPLLGLDHLVAIFAVGLWSITSSRKSAWVAPLVFLTAILTGTILGVVGIHMPITEAGIVGSLLFFGVMMAMNAKVDSASSLLLIGILATCHGLAHGSEMASAMAATSYMTGLLFSSAVLLVTARLISISAQKTLGDVVLKVSGLVVAAVGSVLAFV